MINYLFNYYYNIGVCILVIDKYLSVNVCQFSMLNMFTICYRNES
jgi:hypothetical protein